MENNIILRSFADNSILFEAVKDYILQKFALDDSKELFGLDDESIGQIIRARLDGRQKVEDAFQEMSHYKSVKVRPEQTNPAR